MTLAGFDQRQQCRHAGKGKHHCSDAGYDVLWCNKGLWRHGLIAPGENGVAKLVCQCMSKRKNMYTCQASLCGFAENA